MNTFEDFLKTHQAGAILDIACGGGNFTRRLTSCRVSDNRFEFLTID